MGILLVYTVYHLTSVGKGLSDEVHGVPGVVAAPVLPVLYDAIERHTQLAVFVDYLQ